jgi:hypothetical protein
MGSASRDSLHGSYRTVILLLVSPFTSEKAQNGLFFELDLSPLLATRSDGRHSRLALSAMASMH